MTQEQILRYIQNEKDMSRYQISMIEKSQNITPAKRRILSIEKEFLGLPLEEMIFEDVADVAAAISIYRSSRNLFYETYKLNPPEIDFSNKGKILSTLQRKISFLQKTSRDLITTRVQELNLVQNSDFYYDLAKRQALKNGTTVEFEKRQLDAMNLKMLIEIEPLTLAKKRARAQAVTYSIGRILEEKFLKFQIKEDASFEELQNLNEQLNQSVKNLKFEIFKYYNEGLEILPETLKGTMGNNVYLSKLHNLQNIFDFSNFNKYGIFPQPISRPIGFNSQAPLLGNIFFGAKKVIANSASRDAEKKLQNKVFGILLPIPRKGNEKMSLLYKDIYLDDFNISHLFSEHFSNIKAVRGNKEIYFKALLLEPIWKLIQLANVDQAARYLLSKIIGIQEKDFLQIDFDQKQIIYQLNNYHTGFFPLSENSVVLAARTRSEEEGLEDIFPIIHTKVSEIYDDYLRLDGPTNESF